MCGCDEEPHYFLFDRHHQGAVPGDQCRVLATSPHAQPLPGSRYLFLCRWCVVGFLMGVRERESPRWKGSFAASATSGTRFPVLSVRWRLIARRWGILMDYCNLMNLKNASAKIHNAQQLPISLFKTHPLQFSKYWNLIEAAAFIFCLFFSEG